MLFYLAERSGLSLMEKQIPTQSLFHFGKSRPNKMDILGSWTEDTIMTETTGKGFCEDSVT